MDVTYLKTHSIELVVQLVTVMWLVAFIIRFLSEEWTQCWRFLRRIKKGR